MHYPHVKKTENFLEKNAEAVERERMGIRRSVEGSLRVIK